MYEKAAKCWVSEANEKKVAQRTTNKTKMINQGNKKHLASMLNTQQPNWTATQTIGVCVLEVGR